MNKKWWHSSVVYQVYPRSFMDSNDDGLGDIQGLISKLDYLEYLGIDVIWLCPVYESPDRDNGYDISDYYKIGQQAGTMEDFEELLKEANQRGIKIILDLVVNHTSDLHPWFIESRSSLDNPKRDYYIWRDNKGELPNDLEAIFSGSAWTLDEETDMYYFHLFTNNQPDLNWEHEDMRKDIYEMMNFWLDKGVAGFRMDVIDLIGKDVDQKITENGPKLHEYIKEMNEATFKGRDTLTVGETWGATVENAKLYSNPDNSELSMVFQFEHLGIDEIPNTDRWNLRPFEPRRLKRVMDHWQIELGNDGWNSLFWNNHDTPRIVSRWGNDKKYWKESAKLFGILLHFMKGTPYIYQGEEIGMINLDVESIKDVEDIQSRNMYYDYQAKGWSEERLMAAVNTKGRDSARRPMQWDASKNAGFTNVTPWLEVHPNYKVINVESQKGDKDSILELYRSMIQYRKQSELVVYGDYLAVSSSQDKVYAYKRTFDNEELIVITNISEEEVFETLDLSKYSNVIFQNYDDFKYSKEGFKLRPYEAVVLVTNSES